MKKDIRIVEVASGRDDQYTLKVQGVDGSTAVALVASESEVGLVELATTVEAAAGVDTERAVTPAGLAAAATGLISAASTTVAGKVELATDAEAIAVTDTARAITAHGLGAALGKLFIISFSGRNGSGACTATGLAASDVIRSVAGLTDMGLASSSFESVITVANEIQQSAVGDLSTKNFMALVYRPS